MDRLINDLHDEFPNWSRALISRVVYGLMEELPRWLHDPNSFLGDLARCFLTENRPPTPIEVPQLDIKVRNCAAAAYVEVLCILYSVVMAIDDKTLVKRGWRNHGALIHRIWEPLGRQGPGLLKRMNGNIYQLFGSLIRFFLGE